ncbi:MAG TPA: glycosyl transferase, family 39, partial [Kutzneria sp.]|nr:glycosyl transferase, family 39 [Kutzneria sp.]
MNRGVWIIAGLLGVALVATSWRYGYFGDELYFVAAGHHLDWGYADQPPLVPFLALIADTVAPGSLWVLRIPAML